MRPANRAKFAKFGFTILGNILNYYILFILCAFISRIFLNQSSLQSSLWEANFANFDFAAMAICGERATRVGRMDSLRICRLSLGFLPVDARSCVSLQNFLCQLAKFPNSSHAKSAKSAKLRYWNFFAHFAYFA